MLTVEQLRRICPMPGARAAALLPLLIAAMIEFKITTRTRVAAFLSQCGHESLDFSVWTENLNYSASGLLRTFGKYFNVSTAQTYAGNPRMIANRVYANRMRNDDERSGDGWRYRGRCPIQATGKEMYEWLSEKLNLDLVNNPDLLLEPKNGLRAACAIFAVNKRCNEIADTLAGTGDAVDLARFDRTTKKINGGTNGAADRRTRYIRALKALPAGFSLRSEVAIETQPSENPAKTPTDNNSDSLITTATEKPSSSVKDFTSKYLKHTPADSAKNIFLVVIARITAAATALWNFGFTGKTLLFLIVFAAIVPIVIAVVYYRPRLVDWGKQLWDGFFGE